VTLIYRSQNVILKLSELPRYHPSDLVCDSGAFGARHGDDLLLDLICSQQGLQSDPAHEVSVVATNIHDRSPLLDPPPASSKPLGVYWDVFDPFHCLCHPVTGISVETAAEDLDKIVASFDEVEIDEWA
jgi:hypothetical protein